MKKRTAKKQRIPKVKVKKLKLPATAFLEVALPKGHVPIVATDPAKGVVKIIPVPVRDKTWLEKWFW